MRTVVRTPAIVARHANAAHPCSLGPPGRNARADSDAQRNRAPLASRSTKGAGMASLNRTATRLVTAAAGAPLIAPAGLATTAHADSWPSLGGRIAFDHIVFDGAEDIFTIAPDGSDPMQVTHTPAGQGGSEAPDWTRDGRLLFDSDRAGDIHVFVTDRDGRNTAQVIHSDGSDLSPGISPDGKLLAFEHDSADFAA